MKSEIVAIDFDDVISPQTPAIIAFSREHLGLDISEAAFQHPGAYWGYYENVWRLHGIDDTEGVFEQFLNLGYPLRQHLHEGSEEVIRRLAERRELVIVTSRGSDKFMQGTQELVNKLLPGIFDRVEFVDQWHSDDNKANKGDISRAIGASCLIDDNAGHCNDAAELGLEALLFGDYGWNREEAIHESVVRVSDWPQVAKHFRIRL